MSTNEEPKSPTIKSFKDKKKFYNNYKPTLDIPIKKKEIDLYKNPNQYT